MRDGGGMGESRARAAQRLRHARVRAREAAHVKLVDDRVRPRDARPGIRDRRRRGCHDALGHERSAVGRAALRGGRRQHRRVQRERAIERERIRIDQQLGRVEAMAGARRPGPCARNP